MEAAIVADVVRDGSHGWRACRDHPLASVTTNINMATVISRFT